MISGINLTDRNTQIGLGVAGVALGTAILAKSGMGPQKGIHGDSGSISSFSEDSSSKSAFSFAYEKVFGSKKAEVTSDLLLESTPVEIETQPMQIGKSSKRTFLESLGTLFKAILLLPFVVIASTLKGFFTGISSALGNKVSIS